MALASSGTPRMSRLRSAYLHFRRTKIVTVEPVMFLYLTGQLLFFSVITQYVFNRIGRESLNVVSDGCLTTNTTTGKGREVAEEASYIMLVISIVSQVPSVVPALFYGPISDRYGRKPMLLTNATASCIAATITIIIITLNLNLHYLAIASFFIAIGGGVPGIITITYAYIADVSSSRFLTLRLGVLEGMIFVGDAAGLVAGGLWLSHTGCDFIQPMWLYLACNAFIVFYVVIYLPESLSMVVRQARVTSETRGLKMIVRGIKILFVRQYSRWRIWFSLLVMALTYLIAIGVASVSTLFLLIEPLHWHPGLIGIFQSVAELVNGLILLIVLPILVALRISDTLIVLAAEMIGIIMFILNGFVQTTWQMFVVGLLAAFGSLSGPPIRSIVSKMVAVQDQGALFSIIAITQVLASNISTVIFFFFYPYTLSRGWKSGSVYFLLASLAFIPMPFVFVLFLFRNKPGAVYKQPPLPDNAREDRDGKNEKRSILQSVSSHGSRDSKVSYYSDVSSYEPTTSNVNY